MATAHRERTLINPAGAGRPKKKRKLSEAQLAALRKGQAIMAAKRAAAKRSARPNRPAAAKKKLHKKIDRPANRHRTASRGNPDGIVEVVLLNPAPERKTNVATKSKSKSAPHKHHGAGPKKNPSSKKHYTPSSKKKYRGNPSGGGGNVTSFVTSAAYAIAGAVGSKMLTQAVLGASNTGIVGYGANLAAAFVLGKGVGMVMKNRSAENAIILGGVIQTLLRVIIDNTSLGKQLQINGMGDYLAQDFLNPQTLKPVVNWRRSAELRDPRGTNVQSIAPMQPGAMQSIGRSSLVQAA